VRRSQIRAVCWWPEWARRGRRERWGASSGTAQGAGEDEGAGRGGDDGGVLAEGVDLRGHSKRFGLVHVDFATQRRTVRDSGRWFATVTRANGLPAV
jgi:hypothetical protein